MRRGTLLWWLGLLLLAACSTAPRPVAVFRSRADPYGSRLVAEVGQAKDGTSEIRLSGGPFQSGIVSGQAETEGEGWRIRLVKLDWFNNWPNGWTQAAFRLDGVASLQPSPSGWRLTTERAPQLDIVESASIRYFDSYLRGDRGVTEFSRRWDRIQAVAKDLSTRLPLSTLGDPRKLRRQLFPELYGYDSAPDPKHGKIVAQGYEWNLDYSKENFSEPVRILRDSGTLLRDYKESPGLLFLDMRWKDVWEQADRTIVLEKE